MLSKRLESVLNALPLEPGMRVLEIGCGPGALAREIALRLGSGHVLGIDRSARAIALAKAVLPRASGATLEFRCVAVEDFLLEQSDKRFDLAVAIRVGALDGRHPELGRKARVRLRASLRPGALLLIDGGKPLRSVPLDV